MTREQKIHKKRIKWLKKKLARERDERYAQHLEQMSRANVAVETMDRWRNTVMDGIQTI